MSDRARLCDLAVSESGFVFDPMSGATFNANASGLAIIDGLKQGKDRNGIVALLEERFEVAGADLDRDLDELVALLRDHGLVSRGFSVDGSDA